MRNNGFTLVEMMVATIILFSTVAAVSLVYSSSIKAASRAEAHIKLSTVLPVAHRAIQHKIREQGLLANSFESQVFQVLDTQVAWHAELQAFKSPPERMDVDSGKYITLPKRYKLWRVTIELEYEGTKRHYELHETSW